MSFKKTILLVLAVALLVGSGFLQKSLNHDRDELGLTRLPPLENAPPMLAFTTVALGGFRGLISNALWIRASDLQDEDKFFEMAQLADWITKLEPHFVQVWLVQAWNMAYNISVKFKDSPDRWRWVRRGIELLRDDGLRYNPNELLIYRELAWFFQHKMGQNLDDASMYYKQEWANEMATVFAKKTPNLDELIHPQTEDQKKRAKLLREKFKMDPAFMQKVDHDHGPLEWRLPEASAIYWAALGLEKAKENPTKIKEDDLITLRRVIYQSMQMAFQRGRLISNIYAGAFEFGPNLDIVPKVNSAYERAAEEDKAYHDHILVAHRNFLRDAVYFLYEYNRIGDANYWFKYLGQKYPNKIIIDADPNSYPTNVNLERYVVSRVQEDVEGTPLDRIKGVIEGMIVNSYSSLILDEDAHAEGYRNLAHKIWQSYQSRIPQDRIKAIGLPPFEDIARDMANRMLEPNPERGLPPEARAVLRTRLGLPAETTPPSPATNSPPVNVSG